MKRSRPLSTILDVALDGDEPGIILDTHGAMAIGAGREKGAERKALIRAYADALRIGDRVRWAQSEGNPREIAWMRHPRPVIDAITLEWLRRAGAIMRDVATEGRRRATVWHHPSPPDWLHMYGVDQGVNLAQRLGEVGLCHMTGHPALIELRGTYIIADLDLLPETVKTGMVGDAFAGRRVGDLIDGLDRHCGLSGDEIIASIDIREDGDFHSTSIHFETGDPIPLSDLL